MSASEGGVLCETLGEPAATAHHLALLLRDEALGLEEEEEAEPKDGASQISGILPLTESSSYVGSMDIVVRQSTMAQVRSIHGSVRVCDGSVVDGEVSAKRTVDVCDSKAGSVRSLEGAVHVANSTVGRVQAAGTVTITGTSSVGDRIEAGERVVVDLAPTEGDVAATAVSLIRCSKSASVFRAAVKLLELKRAASIDLGQGSVVDRVEATVPLDAKDLVVSLADTDSRIGHMVVRRHEGGSEKELCVHFLANGGVSTVVDFCGCSGTVTIAGK